MEADSCPAQFLIRIKVHFTTQYDGHPVQIQQINSLQEAKDVYSLKETTEVNCGQILWEVALEVDLWSDTGNIFEK